LICLDGKSDQLPSIHGGHTVAVRLGYASSANKPIDELVRRLGQAFST
jgi:hypothetical protein